MEAFGNLAKYLIAEMPVAKLQEQLGGGERFDGALCGGSCGGPIDGLLCGAGCRPKSGAPDVIDPEGRLGLTAKDLAAIRSDMPQLRKAVLYQLRTHIHQLKPGARPA
ncbi:MAG: hypothetical protein HXY30_20500 [Pseudorhodoplanes sp.]|nr:hypothetical protein [Pseudorhodoplanes sp.]